jgi:hypothetical protein
MTKRKHHYQTPHVLRRIGGNYCSLHDGGLQVPGEDWPEPKKPDEGLTKQLDDLFNGGAILTFEMDFGWDDELGNCYQAFILKAEFVQDYSNRFVDSNDPTYPAREYASAPGRYWILWQGPY